MPRIPIAPATPAPTTPVGYAAPPDEGAEVAAPAPELDPGPPVVLRVAEDTWVITVLLPPTAPVEPAEAVPAADELGAEVMAALDDEAGVAAAGYRMGK